MKRKNLQAGLTLIEILLALIVMVVGIVGILALFPPALESAKISMEDTQAAMMAESVGSALATAIKFAYVNGSDTTATLTHDLQDGSGTYVKYQFHLPKLGTGAVWQHHPPKNNPAPPVYGSIPTPKKPEEDPAFSLKGDGWIALAHDGVIQKDLSINKPGDNSDPYGQFGFSFDVRKINTLGYMLNNPAFTKADGVTEYGAPAELDPLVKLYEFRIHIFRVWDAVGGGGSGGAIADKTLVATVTTRVSTK